MNNFVDEKREQMKSPDDLEPEMVYVEGGIFKMGNERGYNNSEKPVHEVTVSNFYISKYPITAKQYRLFCKNTGKNMPKAPPWGWRDDHPIVNVNWEEAKAYCEWKNGRLPTEAEWEFAAKGGNKSLGYEYSGHNKVDKVAQYSDQTYMDSDQTYMVGKKAANELNLYDMNGNVWEWCIDWYGNYHGKPQNNPQGATKGNKRVQRGGSWRCGDYQLRVTNRRGESPEYNYGDDVGFRLVKENIELTPDFPDEDEAEPLDKPDDPLILSLNEQIASLNERIFKFEELLKILNQQVASLKFEVKKKKPEPSISRNMPFKNKISSIRERIHLIRLTDLEQQWTTLNEKRSRLENKNILETRVEETIRLEDMIKGINVNCQKIDQEISELETQL